MSEKNFFSRIDNGLNTTVTLTRNPETWIPVPGKEGLVEVSDQGRFRSPSGRILRVFRLNGKGAAQVAVWDGKSSQSLAAARVVASVFVQPGFGAKVEFKDGDPLNLHPSNLRWADYKSKRAAQKAIVRHGGLFNA